MSKRTRPDREDYGFIVIIITWPTIIWCAYTYQACGAIFDQCAFESIEKWQTLIVGILAVLVASFSYWQIKIHEQNRYKNKANSHRAALNLVLSGINDIIAHDKAKIENYLALIQHTPAPSIEPFSWDKLGDSDLETIRLLIENETANTKIKTRLELLLTKMQIYWARRRHNPLSNRKRNAQQNLFDCIELYALTNSLFDYARPENMREIKITEAERLSAAHNLGYWGIENDPDEDFAKLLLPKMMAKKRTE